MKSPNPALKYRACICRFPLSAHGILASRYSSPRLLIHDTPSHDDIQEPIDDLCIIPWDASRVLFILCSPCLIVLITFCILHRCRAHALVMVHKGRAYRIANARANGSWMFVFTLTVSKFHKKLAVRSFDGIRHGLWHLHGAAWWAVSCMEGIEAETAWCAQVWVRCHHLGFHRTKINLIVRNRKYDWKSIYARRTSIFMRWTNVTNVLINPDGFVNEPFRGGCGHEGDSRAHHTVHLMVLMRGGFWCRDKNGEMVPKSGKNASFCFWNGDMDQQNFKKFLTEIVVITDWKVLHVVVLLTNVTLPKNPFQLTSYTINNEIKSPEI